MLLKALTISYREPAFQIGTTPMRALDLDLRNERRVCDRRSLQEVLEHAERRARDRRFDSRPVSIWGDV